MIRYGDLLLSIKFKAINGKEYENNPSKIIMNNDYEKELLVDDKLEFMTQTLYNKKLSEYISSAGSKVIGVNGNIIGTLIINAQVKKIISSVEETRVNQLGEMWIFDSKVMLL